MLIQFRQGCPNYEIVEQTFMFVLVQLGIRQDFQLFFISFDNDSEVIIAIA